MQARGNDGRTSGGRDEREEGSNANEGEGLYRYVPAAVVCNIMITLPACAWLLSALLLSHSISLSLSLSLFLSFPSYAYTPGGHPLSAAMLPGNMIIVIICTLLRSYPPDSSPLRNSPVILPAWLPPFSLSLLHPFSLFLFIPLSQHPRSRAILRNASQLSPVYSPSRHAGISFPLPPSTLSRHPATPFSCTLVLRV